MAICSRCKTEETQLYVNGVPICVKCEEKKMQGIASLIPPPDEESPNPTRLKGISILPFSKEAE